MEDLAEDAYNAREPDNPLLASTKIDITRLRLTTGSYIWTQHLLKPVFVDIPVVVREWMNYRYLPAYLLEIDFSKGMAYCKAILHNMPPPLLIGTQIIDYKRPSFVYLSVPLGHLALLYNFAPLQQEHSEDINDHWKSKTVDDIRPLLPGIRDEDVEIAKELLSEVDAQMGIGVSDFFPDTSLETMEPHHARSMPKSSTTQEFKYEALNEKLTEQMINNRALLSFLNVAVHLDESCWEMVPRSIDIDVKQVENSVHFSVAINKRIGMFYDVMNEQYDAFLRAIEKYQTAENFLFSELENADNLVTELINMEQLAHSQLAQAGIKPKFEFNFLLVSETLKTIRKTSTSLNGLSSVGDLPLEVESLLLYKMQIYPLMIMLHAAIAYFDGVHENGAENYDIFKIHNLFKVHGDTLEFERISDILEEIRMFLKPQSQLNDQFFGKAVTRPLPKILENFAISVELLLEIRVSSLNFIESDEISKLIMRSEACIEALLFCLRTTQSCIMLNVNFAGIFKTTEFMLIDLRCFVSDTKPEEILLRQSEDIMSYIVAESSELFDATIVSSLHHIFEEMVASTQQVEEKIQSLFQLEHFVVSFSNWKQYNTQFLFYERLSTPAVLDTRLYVSSTDELGELHICNLDISNFILDYSEIESLVLEFIQYNELLDQLSELEFCCYFLKFDLSFATQTLRRHFDSCIFSVFQQIENVLCSAYSNISAEYKEIRDIIELSICSPQFRGIIGGVLERFNEAELKRHFDIMYSGIIENIEGLYATFQKFYRPGYLNNLVTPQKLDTINAPIYALARLASARHRYRHSHEANHTKTEFYLLETFEWLEKTVVHMYDYVKALMGLDFMKQQEMVANPVKFYEQNQIIGNNLELPLLLIDNDDTLLRNNFLEALMKTTKLKLKFSENEEEDSETDIYATMGNKYERLADSEMRVLELYRKYDYRNVPAGVHPPPIDINKLFCEAKYVLNELVAIQKWLEGWLCTLEDEGDKVKRLLQRNVFPSVFSLNNAIAPLYEIFNGVAYLQAQHNEGISLPLVQYPAEVMLETLERVSMAIEVIRDRVLRGEFVIYSSIYDFVIKQNTSEEELEALKIGAITYENYQDYLIFAEDYVLKFVPSVNYMYLLESRHFCNSASKEILALLKLHEEELKTLEARVLLERFESDNEIFDLLLTMWYNEKINFDITKMLRQCTGSIKSIIVEAAFEHIIDSTSAGNLIRRNDLNGEFVRRNDVVNINRVMLVVILPHYTSDIVGECLQEVSLVTNNAGYINHGYDAKNEDMFEKRLLHHYLREKDNQYSKWRYSKRTEQLARNLESLALLVQMVVEMLEYIPDILLDLELVFCNATHFAVDDCYRKLVTSVLSVEQKMQILNAIEEWGHICSIYFPKGVEVSIASLATNDDFVDRTAKLLRSVEKLHSKVQEQTCSNLEEDLTIVPSGNGMLAPLSLLLPGSFRFKFISVGQIREILDLPIMRTEILSPFTSVTINKLNELTALQSNDEFLSMVRPVDLPQQSFFVFDIILEQSGNQLERNCMSAYDVLFVQILKYIQLREGQDPVYLADLRENSEYVGLPVYFKLFEDFFDEYRFEEIKVAISTLISSYYRHLFKLAISGKVEQDDFKQVFFIINDLSVAAFLYKQKPDYWREGVVIRLEEWQMIFERAISIFLSRQTYEVEDRSPRFIYQFYNHKTSKIVVTDSENSFFIDVGRHWLGSASVFDANLRLSLAELEISSRILKCIAEGSTVILLGSHGKRYENSEHNILLVELSRMLFRRYIFVVVSEFTFNENLKKICACLMAGYLVEVIGIEYLPENCLLQIASLANDLRNRTGYFPLLKCVKNVRIDGNGKQEQELENIEISACNDVGVLLFYLPEQYEIESSYDFKFTKAKELSEKEIKLHYSFASKKESSQRQNVVELYQIFYQSSQRAITISSCFSNAVLISVEEQNPTQQFLKASEQHGKAFYEIQTFLEMLNSSFVSINEYDIPEIYNRARDKSDNFSVAVATLDYISRELIKLEEGHETRLEIIELLANTVSCAFALDKNNSAQILEQAKSFAQYINVALKQFSSSEDRHYDSSETKYSFAKYFQDHLERNYNPEFASSLQLYSNIYQLPLQCISDILSASEYLKSKNPLLLVSINHIYLNVFLSVFSIIKKAHLKIVSTHLQLIEELERSSEKKNIIVIEPGSMEDLESMMDELIGLFLAYPVVETRYGHSIYWEDDKNAPIFMLALTTELYASFLKLETMDMFTHRMLLIPSIENSLGSKLNLISNLCANLDISTLETDFAEQTEREQLKFVTNSLTAQNLIYEYQTQMATSFIKLVEVEEADRKCLALPNYVKVCFFVLFDIMYQVFGIGKSEQEVLLLRSLVDYFLLRFKCLRVQNKQVDNKFIEFAFKELEALLYSDVRRKEMLYDVIKHSDNNFQRFSALEYIGEKPELTNSKYQKGANNISTELEVNCGQLSQLLKLDSFTPDAQINGFSREMLREIEEHLVQLTQNAGAKVGNAGAEVVFSSMNATETDRIGYGLDGSLQYQLAEEFIKQAYMHDKDALNSFVNVLLPLAISFWNAGSLYYAVVSNHSRHQWHTSKRGMAKTLEEKYSQFIKTLSDWQLEGQLCFVGIGAAVLLNLENEQPNFNRECVKQFTRLEFDCETLHKLQHNLQEGDIRACYKEIFSKAGHALPQFSHDPFSYITYSYRIVDNKESKLYQRFVYDARFIPFQLGRGILANVFKGYTREAVEDFVKELSEDSLNYLLAELDLEREASQIEQQQNTKEQEVGMYEKLSRNEDHTKAEQTIKKRSIIESKNPYDSDEESEEGDNEVDRLRKNEEYADLQDQEIQIPENPNAARLIANFVDSSKVSCSIVSDEAIHMDSHRVALCVVIAASMLSPLTACVCGPRRSGKSVLIDIAKLLVRDLCSQSLFQIQDTQGEGDTLALRSALARKSLSRRRAILQLNASQSSRATEWPIGSSRILSYYATIAYHACHIQASNSYANVVSAPISELLENHYLQFASEDNRGHRLFVTSSFERLNGLLELQDTSFIIECLPDSPLFELASVQLHVPPISEQFSVEYAKIIFPQASDAWVRQFVHGIFLVENSLNFSVQTSFDFFMELLHNELLTIGQSTFASPLMVEKISIYETKGIEVEDTVLISPTSNLLRQENDQELASPNIHSYFAALRNMNISELELEAIQEKLVSLCLLGNLRLNAFISKNRHEMQEKNFIATPWSDSQLLLEQNFILHPIWEAYVINEALENARQSTILEQVKLQDSFTLSVQRIQQIIIPKPNSSVLFSLPQLQLKEIAFLTHNFQYNSYLYYHFMEIYRIRGGQHNPIVYNKLIELYYYETLNSTRNRLNSAAKMYFGISNLNTHELTGIAGENDEVTMFNYIFREVNHFSSIIENAFGKNDEALEFLLEEKKRLQSKDVAECIRLASSPVRGFPLMTSLELRPVKHYLFLEHCSATFYESFIHELQDITGSAVLTLEKSHPSIINQKQEKDKFEKLKYKIYELDDIEQLLEEPAFKSVSSSINVQDVLIDVSSIHHYILSEQPINEMWTDLENRMFEYLERTRGHLAFVEMNELGIIMLIAILRFCTLLSLGIDPEAFELIEHSEDSALANEIGIPVRSEFASNYPSKVIEEGRLVNMMPSAICDRGEIREIMDETLTRPIAHLNSLTTQSMINLQKTLEHGISQERSLDSYIGQECSVMLVMPWSLANTKTNSGSSVYELFSRLFEPLNAMPTVFDHEELLVICYLIAKKNKIVSSISPGELSIMLNENFKMLILGDEPIFHTKISLPQIHDLGVVQLPVNGLIGNYKARYHELVQMEQVQQEARQRQNDNLVKELTGGEMGQESQFEAYLKQKEQASKNNVISSSVRDLLPLMKMSRCQVPKDSRLFSYLQIDQYFFKEQYSLVLLAVYQELETFCISPSVSLCKFSQLAAEMCDTIIDQLECFFNEYVLIALLFNFYQSLAEPLKTPIKAVDLHEFSSGYIFEAVNTQLENEISMLKEKDENMPGEKQINLETAAGECVYIRNFFFTILLVLQGEFPRRMFIAQNSHLDAIAATTVLCFGVSDKLDMDLLRDKMLGGCFGELGPDVVSRLKSENVSDDHLNIAIQCIIRDVGLHCEIKSTDSKRAKYQTNIEFTDNGEISSKAQCDLFEIGSQVEGTGQYAYIQQITSILSERWPVRSVLQYFKIQQSPGDVGFAVVNSALLAHQVKEHVLFIENDIAVVTAICVVFALHHGKLAYDDNMNQANEHSSNDNTDGVNNEGSASYTENNVVEECKKFVVMIDCEELDFSLSINAVCCALETDNSVLVFLNCGSRKATRRNSELIGNLLKLAISNAITSEEEHSFYGKLFTASHDIGSIPIIIGFSSEVTTIDEFIAQNGLVSEIALDKIAFLMSTTEHKESIERTRFIRAQENKIHFIEEELIAAVLGSKYCEDALEENARANEIAVDLAINRSQRILEQFTKRVLLTQLFSEGEIKQMKVDEHIFQKISQLTGSGDMLNTTLLQTSYLTSNNGEVERFYDQLIEVYRVIALNIDERAALQSNQEIKQEVVVSSELKHLEMYVFNRNAAPLISNISSALALSTDLFKETQKYHFPSLIMIERDNLNQIFSNIAEEVPQYQLGLADLYKDVPRENTAKLKSPKFLVDEFVLLYDIKHNSETFKKYIVSLIIPFVSAQIYRLFPENYANALWLLNALLFLAKCGIICETTAELESIARVFCYTQTDSVRLATSYHLSQIFNQTSGFNVSKLYSDAELASISRISNISQIIPEICNISSQLQYAWMMFNVIARYSRSMHQSMPWFVTNHASLVTFCQSNNALLSLICYYLSKDHKIFQELTQDASEEKLNEIRWFNNLIALYEKQKNEILDVPPNFRAPSAEVFYLAFCISIALNPLTTFENIEILSYSMRSIFKSSPDQLEEEASTTHGVTTPESFDGISLLDCAYFVAKPLEELLQVCGVKEIENIEELAEKCISKPLFQLYNLVKCAFDHMNEGLSVNIVYYDPNYAIGEMLDFVFETMPKEYSKGAQLCHLQSFDLEQALQHVCVVIVSPSMNGHAVLEQVINCVKTDKQSLQRISYFPVFILTPSTQFSEGLNSYSAYGTTRQNNSNIRLFIQTMQLLQRTSRPNYLYLRQPETLEEAFKHYFCVAAQTLQSFDFHQYGGSNKIKNAITLRGLSLFVFKLSLMAVRQESTWRDERLSAILHAVFIKTLKADNLPIDVTKSPFLARGFADLQLFTQDRDESIDRSYQKMHAVYDKSMRRVLFYEDTEREESARNEETEKAKDITCSNPLSTALPSILTEMLSRSRGIDERIREEMNVQIESNAESETQTDENSESSTTVSVTSSRKSETSEISDGDDDFDDSMSMFSQRSSTTQHSQVSQLSQVSGVSAASSINSTAFNKFGKEQENQRIDEQNYYWNLVSAIALEAGQSFIDTDFNRIEKSVAEIIGVKERRMRRVGVNTMNEGMYRTSDKEDGDQEQQHAEAQLLPQDQTEEEHSEFSTDESIEETAIFNLSSSFASERSVIELLEQLHTYSSLTSLHSQAETDCMREHTEFHTPNPLEAFRRVFSLPCLQSLFCGNEPLQSYNDFEKMPAELLVFLKNAASYSKIESCVPNLFATPESLQKNLAEISINQGANILAGERGFAEFTENWVISASVFGPILGDIFAYIKIYNSVATNSSLARERIIVSDQIPYKQIKILEDGYIDFGNPKDIAASNDKGQKETKQPFYITLRGFELNNIAYDLQQRTVCDFSDMTEKGYIQTFDLYACVCVIDSWQTGFFDEQLGDKEHLHVCDKYVPIPLLIGGYCRPVVLLENKTGISGLEWTNRSPFFGVKEM